MLTWTGSAVAVSSYRNPPLITERPKHRCELNIPRAPAIWSTSTDPNKERTPVLAVALDQPPSNNSCG